MRGVKGATAWMCLILAIVSTSADDQAASEAGRFKRQYGGFGAHIHPAAAVVDPGPGIVPVPGPPHVPVGPGTCPGGPSLGKACDAKRPWPQCPPHSYCFAVNSVDIGPYYCCPVWSTVGAQWRPAAPFYPYYPPMPYNWPYIIQATAHWGAQTSPAAGWLGQFGAQPGLPGGPAGAAYLAPAVPDVPGPYPGGPVAHGGPPPSVPGGPFEKARKKDPEAAKAEAAVAAAEKEEAESS